MWILLVQEYLTIMLKRTSLAVVIGLATLMGCKRELPTEVSSPSTKQPVTKTRDLKITQPFNWKTTKTVTLSAIASPLPVTITHVISIEDEKGTPYAKFNHNMNENLEHKVVVPVSTGRLYVKYGAVTKEVAINDTTATFKFLGK